MTNERIIRDAIGQSIRRDEIVHRTIHADSSDIHELVGATVAAHWDYADENRDEDDNEVMDVFSTEEAGDPWRIKVTFTGLAECDEIDTVVNAACDEIDTLVDSLASQQLRDQLN